MIVSLEFFFLKTAFYKGIVIMASTDVTGFSAIQRWLVIGLLLGIFIIQLVYLVLWAGKVS